MALAEAGVQLLTIGFGDKSIPLGKKGAIDSEALRRLAWPASSQFHAAQDVQSLGKLFGVARQLLVNRWQLTFTTHREDRGQLAGLDLQFQIRVRLADRILKSSWVAFKTPQMSAPPFEGKLDAAERQALTQVSTPLHSPQTSLSGTVAVRRALIFAGFGGLLAFLWFAVPLVLWPSQTARLPNQTGLRVPKPQVSRISSKETLPPSAGMPSLDQLPVHHKPSDTQVQFEPRSSPDRTLFDSRFQQTLGRMPGESSTAELAGKTEIRVNPVLEQPLPPAPTGLDATLIFDRPPDQNQPGQTQIQFAPLPQRSAADCTLIDPRGEQTVVLKPDETVVAASKPSLSLLRTSLRRRLEQSTMAQSPGGLIDFLNRLSARNDRTRITQKTRIRLKHSEAGQFILAQAQLASQNPCSPCLSVSFIHPVRLAA